MGKFVKKKKLTPEQMRRANRTMAFSILVIMIMFLVVEFAAKEYGTPVEPKWLRITIYLVTTLGGGIFTTWKIRSKAPMYVMAIAFTLNYMTIIFSHDPIIMALVFPVLLAMVVYLNGVLIMSGSVVTILLTIIRAADIRMTGGTTYEYQQCNIIVIGLLICIVCGVNAVRLLIDFSNEDQQVIEKKAEEQMQVAGTVSNKVDSLDGNFHSVVDTVTAVNYSLGNATEVIQLIADSTESTANAAERQAVLTSEIQERLEQTNGTAESAMSITKDLIETIANGKKQSDELEKQSVLVDENTAQISNIVESLVENVAQVSNITETILSISSQTNLLALNASIEAARAGEAGRGFAVVAEQIRNLAEETKQATEMITAIIDELTHVTTETKEGLTQSVESIEAQRQIVIDVTESFNHIGQGIEKLDQGMNSMVEEVAAVLEANQTIVSSISTLTGTSQEVAANSATGKETMDTLGDNMRELSNLIEGAFAELQILREVAVIEE